MSLIFRGPKGYLKAVTEANEYLKSIVPIFTI